MAYGDPKFKFTTDMTEHEWKSTIEDLGKILTWLEGFNSAGKSTPSTYRLQNLLSAITTQVRYDIAESKKPAH